jgi:hypothetical protein
MQYDGIEAEYMAYKNRDKPDSTRAGSHSQSHLTLPAPSTPSSAHMSHSPAPTESTSIYDGPPPAKRRKPVSEAANFIGEFYRDGEWPDEAVEEFAADTCDLFVGNGWAFNTVGTAQTKKWMAKWVGKGVTVPDRRELSGPLLDKAVAKVEEGTRAEVEGKYATGQCDGWKNCSKDNLLASMFTVECRVWPGNVPI